MSKDIKKRLEQLRAEYQKGQQMLADQERETAELRASLLRISGAIQVLEEMQEEEEK